MVKRADKHFTVDIQGRKDRLKPAHLDVTTDMPTIPQSQQSTSTTASPEQNRVTCSRRHIVWPAHLSSYVM